MIKRKILFLSRSAALFLRKKGKKADGTEERKRSGDRRERGRERKRGMGPYFYLREKRKRPKGVHQAARLAGTLRERHARTSSLPLPSLSPYAPLRSYSSSFSTTSTLDFFFSRSLRSDRSCVPQGGFFYSLSLSLSCCDNFALEQG